MANLYYCESAPAASFRLGATVEVEGDEARHAVRVARLRVGERVGVSDGRGTIGFGVVTQAHHERFAVHLDEVETRAAARIELVLVQALAKGDRDERAVEQATEYGVDAIVPWQADRSVSRWHGSPGAEKSAKGIAKWARIAREAAKQSMRARIPEIRSVASLPDLCARAADSDCQVFVMHPSGDQRLSSLVRDEAVRAADSICLIVGPEGGLSERELIELESAGARTVVLGPEVLRTSSAGPAALAVLNVALQRW